MPHCVMLCLCAVSVCFCFDDLALVFQPQVVEEVWPIPKRLEIVYGVAHMHTGAINVSVSVKKKGMFATWVPVCTSYPVYGNNGYNQRLRLSFPPSFFLDFDFWMRLYCALRGCSCGSRGFLEDRMMDIITGRAPPPARAESHRSISSHSDLVYFALVKLLLGPPVSSQRPLGLRRGCHQCG